MKAIGMGASQAPIRDSSSTENSRTPEHGRQHAREPGFLSHSLVLGTIAGTKVRLHWTFLLFLVWIGSAFLVSDGKVAAVTGLVLVIVVFACVVAHEFGHILVARRFGYASPDVTLLPIGGIARFLAVPERPEQELAVALAGPAVNLMIAGLLFGVLGVEPAWPYFSGGLQPHNILPALVTINFVLAVFNLLPAFPMDGGRALRALLSMFLERGQATVIAARVGQALAIGLGFLALLSGNLVLILIGLFVYFAASAEAQAMQLHRAAAGLRVYDATLTHLQSLSTSDTLADASRLLLQSDQREFPVVDESGSLAGVLTRDGLIRGLSSQGSQSIVTDWMTGSLPTAMSEGRLIDALPLFETGSDPVVVTDRAGSFRGLLTRDNLGELLLLAHAGPAPSQPFGRAARPTTDKALAKSIRYS